MPDLPGPRPAEDGTATDVIVAAATRTAAPGLDLLRPERVGTRVAGRRAATGCVVALAAIGCSSGDPAGEGAVIDGVDLGDVVFEVHRDPGLLHIVGRAPTDTRSDRLGRRRPRPGRRPRRERDR